jgi:hypothetical protein
MNQTFVILLKVRCVALFNVQNTNQHNHVNQSNQGFKFSLLNPAIVVLPTVFKRALTKTQQHGVCT